MSRFPAWLWALLATAFVLYTDDYVIAGILPELAADLEVTVSQAGQLVTVFSLTVAVAAPVAAVVLAGAPRRALFPIGLLVFAAANLAAVVVPSFAVLMGLRVLAALAAASLTPAIFAFAAQHAPRDSVGRYIAVVSLGVTGSIAAGVPLGTWLGGHLGWRATFGAMAVAGLVVLAAALVTLPRTHQPDELPPLAEQVRTLRGPAISLGLLANCALMTGSMMVLTYLATYLGETTTAGVEERALAFSLAGGAGMLGLWLGGLVTDLWGPDRALAVGVGTFVVAMAGLWGLWLVRPAPIGPVIALTTIWGGMAFWNAPAIQTRLHALAGPLAPQALALNTSGTYVGVAAGAAVGGLVLDTASSGLLPLVAAGFGLAAMALLAWAGRSAVVPLSEPRSPEHA